MIAQYIPRASGRSDPIQVAIDLIDARFPESLAAFLSGSVVTGKATATSDLDIVVITTLEAAPFRESLVSGGWPVEVFVHTLESYARYFESDAKDRIPCLPVMCATGIAIRNCGGIADLVRQHALDVIRKGPEPLALEEIERQRYMLTDMLDDFTGANDRAELLVIAPLLADIAATLILNVHNQWLGKGKWLIRVLKQFDPALEAQMVAALEHFYRHDCKEELAAFARTALDLAGGRVFEGFRRGGLRKADA